MTRYAIDATTLLRLVDEDGPLGPDVHLVAPRSILVDGLDLLLGDVRAGRRDQADALRLHTRMTETTIRLLGDRVSRRRAWDLALEHAWDVRTAEYVAVAMLQADALVAGDPDLRAAADGLVPLAALDALGTERAGGRAGTIAEQGAQASHARAHTSIHEARSGTPSIVMSE